MSYTLIKTHVFECDRCHKSPLPFQESVGNVEPSGDMVRHLGYHLVLGNKFKQKKDLLLCADCTILFDEFMGDA